MSSIVQLTSKVTFAMSPLSCFPFIIAITITPPNISTNDDINEIIPDKSGYVFKLKN